MKNSYSKQGDSALIRSRAFTKPVFAAFLLALNYAAAPSRAATAPSATLIYADPNNASIRGGMATIGSTGASYFSELSTANTRAKVVKLTVSGTTQWTFDVGDGTGYDMYAVPALDAAGAKLYIGSDFGVFYCRKT